jgi:hypothetical protein
MRIFIGLAALLLLSPAFAGEPAKPFSLNGTWSGGGFVIVLQAGGNGTIQDSPQSPAEPMRWKAAAGKLTLTQDGEPVAYDYRVQGGALKLSGGDLDQPVSLTRGAQPPAAAAGRTAPDAKPAPAAAAPKPGDCAHACLHYLVCSGQATYENQAECVAECRTVGYEAPFLGWFESTDCPTAIAVINYLDSVKRGMSGGGGNNGGGDARSSQCNGCVRDGGECNWYSQSNWGSSGAYSGAVITCDQSCCR